jgi:aspartate aminotransferase-like enzyme
MDKQRLFTPGPTPVPPQVLAALAEPVVHHRSPDFVPIYERTLVRLREVCRTESDVLLFGASGTGAFESAVANLVSPGEPHLVVSAGNFGERWAAMTTAYGADVDVLGYAWGETPDPEDVRARLAEREAKAVWVVQSETSTGVVADVKALAAAAKDGGALVVVDAVSSLGAVPCETDAWGLDVVVSGSQRSLMRPSRPAAPRRASTSTGSGRALRSTSSTRRSRRRSRSSPDSTSRSACSSRRASRRRSSDTSASAAPAARARRRSGWSCSRRTRTAARS